MVEFLKTAFWVVLSLVLHGVLAWLFIKAGERTERLKDLAHKQGHTWRRRFWMSVMFICYGIGGLVLLDLASMFYGSPYE
jgi:hypothetical protein